MKKLIAPLVIATFALSGCYHATVDTGLAPSGETVENNWAHGFLYGLVGPSTVETAAACPNGVAQVETVHSFVNLLAQFITFGLYAPMSIKVQCAAAGGMDGAAASLEVRPGDSQERAAEVIQEAAKASLETGAPVLVRFAR